MTLISTLLNQITDRIVSALQPTWIDYVLAIATMLAVVAALLIAVFGDVWKRKHKVELYVDDGIITSQRTDSNRVLILIRLRVKNIGKRKINTMRCNIEQIEELDSKGIHIRPNFIPIPLNWTHGSSERNIAMRETALLDVVQHLSTEDDFRICWPDGRLPLEPSLSRLPLNAINMLYLNFYEDENVGTVRVLFSNPVLRVFDHKPIEKDLIPISDALLAKLGVLKNK
jgi:hypothetical protein